MAGIETYGGCCPKCLRGMEQKFESSWSGFMFDACSYCGFIYADEGKVMTIEEKEQAWASILDHFQVSSREELRTQYPEKEYPSAMESEFYPSLFDYSDEEDTLDIYRLMWKRYGAKNPTFAIKGQRVYWHEDRDKEGDLLEFEEGKISIQWDEQKESNLPCTVYPAIELGKTVLLLNPLDSPPQIGEDDWVNEEVFAALNYLQRKGNEVRELREEFMSADTELFVATESNNVKRLNKAQENLAEIVDKIRELCKSKS
ncbi:hypothetical protein ACFVS2_25360 [Brevibacillus sp. NPDC058079]|uniref:hypothetical protein n=1 Tax=Brevibacillus sp. NPDC058079 TaxID=3346330 RepID=UPI0036E8192E